MDGYLLLLVLCVLLVLAACSVYNYKSCSIQHPSFLAFQIPASLNIVGEKFLMLNETFVPPEEYDYTPAAIFLASWVVTYYTLLVTGYFTAVIYHSCSRNQEYLPSAEDQEKFLKNMLSDSNTESSATLA